jgi:tetratricopeptide (TPR) repeat protein/2-polyprenyl-3-methyl-5-hydroxy-6-metoxy-1,4-benzoquinol methylase
MRNRDASIGDGRSGQRVPLSSAADKAAELYNKATMLKTGGRFDEAIEGYREALSIRPTFAEAHNSLGNALADQGRLDEAVSSYNQALSVNPAYAEAHSNLATVLLDQGKHQEAVASFRRAITLRPAFAGAHYNLGNAFRRLGKVEEAIASYRSAISAKPDFADAYNNLGVALLEQGRPDEAASSCRTAILLAPQFAPAHNNLGNALGYAGNFAAALASYRRAVELEDASDFKANFARCIEHLDVAYVDAPADRDMVRRAMTEAWARPTQLSKTVSRLIAFDPQIRPLIESAVMGWSTGLPQQRAYTQADVATLGANALLTSLLQIAPIGDISLERCLTAVRRLMLDTVTNVAIGSVEPEQPILSFYCALARQCFINEYIFSCTEAESREVEELRERIVDAMESGHIVPTMWLVTIGAYTPLSSLPSAEKLLHQSRSPAVSDLLAQQIAEPALERELRSTIQRLTAIHNEVSRAVQRQYEENPYPRWVKSAATQANTLGAHIERELQIPGLQRVLQAARAADILVAGCGTGQETIEIARQFPTSRILAIDLSLSSLCYAKRKTAELELRNVEYAQADIMALDSIDRTFDIIYCVGVLHHLAEPTAGWKQLCSILRDRGLMRLGFYSERARMPVSAARAFISESGYVSTAADIRRCREDVISRGRELGLTELTGFGDFYAMSECRDLLFHVKEHCYTILQLKEMLGELGLTFLGFSVEPNCLRMYRQRFPEDKPSGNLDHWHVFEAEQPRTFVGMYQFWVCNSAELAAVAGSPSR